MGQSINHTTVHRRLQELAGNHDPFGVMKERAFRFLVVDGTKVHLQGPAGKDVIVYRGRGPIEPRFRKNRLDKSCSLGYCRVDESGQAIQRQF